MIAILRRRGQTVDETREIEVPSGLTQFSVTCWCACNTKKAIFAKEAPDVLPIHEPGFKTLQVDAAHPHAHFYCETCHSTTTLALMLPERVEDDAG